MEDNKWSEHLNHWQLFLEERLRLTTDEPGEQTKIKRQIRAINTVRYGAVLNPTVLLSFIQPGTQRIDYPILYWSLNLNSSQQVAVKTALSDNALTLIQGPPGTGKTQVIAETCLQLYQSNPSIRILVCSETHIAVNNVLDRVGNLNDEMRIVRIQDKEESSSIINYSSESILENYSAWLDENVTNETISQILQESFINSKDKRGTEKALFLSSNLVGMTCNRVGAYNLINSDELFDVVIIDEVCKATLPEILMPLSISKKAVLVGDPKQLPPVFSTEERSVIESIENSNLQDYKYINELFEGDNGAVLLDTQYRMSSQIGKLISDLFYSGKLIDGRKEEISDAVNWIDYKPTKKWPLDVEIKSDNPKIFNLDECKIILQLVNLLSKLDNVGSIAIADLLLDEGELVPSTIKEFLHYHKFITDDPKAKYWIDTDLVQSFIMDFNNQNIFITRAIKLAQKEEKYALEESVKTLYGYNLKIIRDLAGIVGKVPKDFISEDDEE